MLRRRAIFSLCALTMSCVASGCNIVSAERGNKAGELTAAEIKAGLDEAKAEILKLQKDVLHLRLKTIKLEKAHSVATFNPREANGFHRVDSSIGTFLIMITSVDPYLDGYKVKMRVGNPSAVRYSGATIVAEWGRKMLPNEQYSTWKLSQGSKQFTITKNLEAGAWNLIDIVIAPATANDLDTIRLSLETTEIELLSDR